MDDLQLHTGSSGSNKGVNFDLTQFEYDSIIEAYFSEIERKEIMTEQQAVEFIRQGGDVGQAAQLYIESLDLRTSENPLVLFSRIRTELVQKSTRDF